MSSPSARAEARRKAILARGSDRLSKLTSSARGEDPAYMHDDPPLPSITPVLARSAAEDGLAQSQPQAFSQPAQHSSVDRPLPLQEQQQLLAALLGASGHEIPSRFSSPLSDFAESKLSPHVNPPSNQKTSLPKVSPTQVSLLARSMLPLLHLLSMWCLLGYFVIQVQPYATEIGGRYWIDLLRPWKSLSYRHPVNIIEENSWSPVPFFWTFAGIQLALHCMRIFLGYDSIQVPMILSLAMPSLPPSISSVLMNGLRYTQMLSHLLDDIAGLLVGVGFVIYVSMWIVG